MINKTPLLNSDSEIFDLIQKEEKRKKISFGPNFYRGGKTKKRRQNRKKTQSRKPKKRLTIKRKNNKK